jgi:hypothetical protein
MNGARLRVARCILVRDTANPTERKFHIYYSIDAPTLRVQTSKYRSRRHGPRVRDDATHLARPRPDILTVLVDLLQDLNSAVAGAAACALGRMGRTEGRSMPLRVLRDDPTVDVIDAVSDVADEQIMVMLGRGQISRILQLPPLQT